MKWVPGFVLSFNRFRLTWSLLCPREKKKGGVNYTYRRDLEIYIEMLLKHHWG